MNNRVRTVFNRRKQASDTTCAAVEIVVCLGRERFYFSTGIFLNTAQWLDGKVINHPKATVFNEQIQKKITEFERIIIAMEVNGDDMTTHVARHTFACTISLGEGIPKEVLQVMMGHSSIRTTELYAKLPIEFVTRNLDKKLFHVWG